VKDSDLTINTYPPRNKGGQHVGKLETGVHLTHNPTGIQVIVCTERSQLKNKRIAQSMIEWGLVEIGWKE